MLALKLAFLFVSTTYAQWSKVDPKLDFRVPRDSEYVLPSGTFYMKKLVIEGILKCAPKTNVVLHVDAVLIDGGQFICGQDVVDHFKGRLQVQMRSIFDSSDSSSFKVQNGGVLRLHGRPRTSWTRLTKTVQPGSNVITVPSEVEWTNGDEVVIAPTDFEPFQYETFRLTRSVRKGQWKELTLNQTVKFRHLGEHVPLSPPPNSNDEGEWNLEARAEVALLTRNIQLYGNQKLFHNRRGIRVMITKGSFGYIGNVDIRYGGVFDVIGEYPMHFHLIEDGSGQYFANSSIYRSWNRCVSVHCTDNLLIQKNSCTDHIGHGYFLEDGSEKYNKLQGNLGISTRAGTGNLNPSDRIPENGHDAGPATFWAVGTDNNFFGNVAAGSAWSGFSFEGTIGMIIFLQSRSQCKHRNNDFWALFRTKFGAFRNFTAHSTGASGLWMEGYQPQERRVLHQLLTYKIGESAIHLGTSNVEIRKFVVSDSIRNLWSTWTSAMIDGIVIGQSRVFDGGMSYPAGRTERHGIQVLGNFIYDGPSSLYNIRWENFNFRIPGIGGEVCHFVLNGGGGASSKNTVSGHEFKNPDNPYFCPKTDFLPKIWDLDGSLTGEAPGSFVMNDANYRRPDGSDLPGNGIDPLIDDGSCHFMKSKNNPHMIVCGPGVKSAHFMIQMKPDLDLDGEFVVTRPGYPPRLTSSRGRPFSDYVVYLRSDIKYQFKYDGSASCFFMQLRDGQRNEVFEISFERKNRSGKPKLAADSRFPSVDSLNALKSASTSAQYYDGTLLHVAIRVDQFLPLSSVTGEDLEVGGFEHEICF